MPARAAAPDFGHLLALFKALSHEGRLRILWELSQGERSVTALERALGERQAAVSQQLARLRLDRLVATRREGRVIHYRLSDPRVAEALTIIPRPGRA